VKLSRAILTGTVMTVIVLQFISLGFPAMNGDEALYQLVVEELRKLLSGQMPSLNPVIDYSGPLDFWLMGSVYGITSFLPWLQPGAWMVRIVPLVFFWTAAYGLFTELKRHHDKPSAYWFVLLAATTPMAMVYSRISFPHALLLCAMMFLTTESLRIRRDALPGFLRIAFLCGFAMETNTTAVIGMTAILVPSIKNLFKAMRRHYLRALASALFFAVLAYPVARNFPPPVTGGEAGSAHFWIELRSLLNIMAGIQPLEFLMGRDPAPLALKAAAIMAALALMAFGAIKVFKQPWRESGWLKQLWLTQLAGTFLVTVICYRGRSLQTLGHERYLIALVPGWLILASDALTRLASPMSWNAYRRETLAVGISCTLAAFGLFRLPIPAAMHAFSHNDNSLNSARWLMHHCKRGECAAYAENFWNYWPIRYYARAKLDLGYTHHNWKTMPQPDASGKHLAGCWYSGSQFAFKRPGKSRVDFLRSPGNPAQFCKKVSANFSQ